MQQINSIVCESITKLNIESQNQRLRLFAKVDLTTKLKILERQKQQFHKSKQNYSDADNAVLMLASLILAIDLVVGEIDDVNLNIIKMRGKNNRKSLVRERLIGYWAIVRSLKLEL